MKNRVSHVLATLLSSFSALRAADPSPTVEETAAVAATRKPVSASKPAAHAANWTCSGLTVEADGYTMSFACETTGPIFKPARHTTGSLDLRACIGVSPGSVACGVLMLEKQGCFDSFCGECKAAAWNGKGFVCQGPFDLGDGERVGGGNGDGTSGDFGKSGVFAPGGVSGYGNTSLECMCDGGEGLKFTKSKKSTVPLRKLPHVDVNGLGRDRP
ncbi:hypothetical protein F5Y15DRAFT_88813 [Xylariaceae sp. FL0016]|nr:hypothetical protein F5Y15DRAFT_88813 [Xylariaceae sp. FL0016]